MPLIYSLDHTKIKFDTSNQQFKLYWTYLKIYTREIVRARTHTHTHTHTHTRVTHTHAGTFMHTFSRLFKYSNIVFPLFPFRMSKIRRRKWNKWITVNSLEQPFDQHKSQPAGPFGLAKLYHHFCLQFSLMISHVNMSSPVAAVNRLQMGNWTTEKREVTMRNIVIISNWPSCSLQSCACHDLSILEA